MKKSISIVIIGILVLSGLGAVALPATTHNTSTREQQTQTLSNLQVSETTDYTIVTLEESTSMLRRSGEPNLPVVTEIFTYPFDTMINSVEVVFSEPQEIEITKPIEPAPEPIPLNMEQSLVVKSIDQTIYTSDSMYPIEQYSYSTSVGIDKGVRTLFVAVHCYPVQYTPVAQKLFYSDSIEITITHTLPKNPTIFGDSFDLVILAPEQFSSALQPLVNHKISNGIATTLVTLESILSSQTGRDDAEKVKYYIKEAVEDMGVTYVLIVGGMNGQRYQWLFPVRYTNNYAGATYEYGVLSDLYYADIYKYDNVSGYIFDDWDSNGNDVFAEFISFSQKDILDLAPDVFVGRLPCRTLAQVETSVEKLIAYESTKADPSWFNNLLLIAGDTYQDSPGGLYEGELANDYTASFMTNFTPIRLWASNGALTGQESVENAINDGAGFVHMAGHANPSILVTHPPQNNSKITILRMYHMPLLDFIGYIGRGKIDKAINALLSPRNPRLTNAYKLPVIVIGGCHNSQFNTTLLNIITHNFTHAYGYGEYVPKCFSWYLTNLENGGAIATMGNTGLGMGLHDAGYTTGLDGWLMPQFFKHYGVNNETYIGAAHSYAIRDYTLNFDCNADSADRQMLEQWPLLGDPSMLIGGYD